MRIPFFKWLPGHCSWPVVQRVRRAPVGAPRDEDLPRQAWRSRGPSLQDLFGTVFGSLETRARVFRRGGVQHDRPFQGAYEPSLRKLVLERRYSERD